MITHLGEIAKLVEGKLVGDENLEITGIAPIGEAKIGNLTFILEKKFFPKIKITEASALVVPSNFKIHRHISKALIFVDQPRYALAKILNAWHEENLPLPGIHSQAVIGTNCQIAKDVSIQAFVFIGNNVVIGNKAVIFPGVYIGDNSIIGSSTIIYPRVTIYQKCIIGHRVIIHAGCVIGSDGFGYIPVQGKHKKIKQIGQVIIEDDVELGSNVTVDRATMGATKIGYGTKVDNLVHIAHNVVIGENCLIISHTGLAGSAKVGHNVTLAGYVGVANHVEISDRTIVGARSGVTKSFPSGSVISGFPAQEHRRELSQQALLRRLPYLLKKINKLEKKMATIETQ